MKYDVMRLINKYADERHEAPTVLPQESDSGLTHQRKRLADFAHGLQNRLRVLIIEIEHDISVLKLRTFDKDMLNLLKEIWRSVISIFQTFDEDKPYDTADKIIAYTNNKHTKAVIDNLDFLAKHHMEQTNEKFSPMRAMKHPEVRSLKLLISLSDYLEQYMLENPLIEKKKPQTPAMLMPTFRPPSFDKFPAVKIPSDAKAPSPEKQNAPINDL